MQRLLLILLFFTAHHLAGGMPPIILTRSADAPEPREEMIKGEPGPWGSIEFCYLYLEAPDNLVDSFPLPSPQTRWVFPQSDASRLDQMLSTAGLSASAVKTLLDPQRVVTTDGKVYLFPLNDLIKNLATSTRESLYSLLRSNGLNPYHQNPIMILSGDVSTWADDSGLSDAAIATIKSLAYDMHGVLAFSDIPLFLSEAGGDAEARLRFKKLTRVRTLMARLHIDRDSDVHSLVDYWSTGMNLRRKDIEPLFHAVRRTNGAAQLDLAHLLPSYARKLLYTYPDGSMMSQGLLPDCHWTTLNFFNYEPQQYYLDTRNATNAVLENFEKVAPPYRIGDVLMFMDANGFARHSCNYLAADIVFTKNGRNPAIPWTLMELSDLKKIYLVNSGETQIQGYRHKKAIEAGK